MYAVYNSCSDPLFVSESRAHAQKRRYGKEVGAMYGLLRRKKCAPEIRLVRMNQYDSGFGKGYGKRRRKQFGMTRRRRKITAPQMLSLLFTALLLLAAGFLSGVRFVKAGGTAQESVTVTENIQFAGGSPADTQETASGAGQIFLLEEQAQKTPLVVIDPGHGGEDEGCSRDGILEKDVNLSLALLLSSKLQQMGIDTELTRENDRTQLSLEERVQFAEDRNADIYISIHQNACEESSAEGIETWYCPGNEDSLRLAKLVNMGALEKTGAKERELVESSELYVIRENSVPSCLIETSFLSNKREREAISDPAYCDKLASGIAWGIQHYFFPKTMYLTFDDGPSEENTAAILDILKEHNIKATFFVVGENVRKHPDIARRIVAEGHTIGIHCNRHNYEEIYQSVDSYLADFQEAYDAVYEVTGVEVKLFRFPGGSINAYNKDVYEEIIEKMTDKGFIYFDWNGSLEDAAKNTTPEELLQNARESTLGRKKVVMLAHDIVYNTTQCLDELILQFPEYKMEPLTPEVAPIHF